MEFSESLVRRSHRCRRSLPLRLLLRAQAVVTRAAQRVAILDAAAASNPARLAPTPLSSIITPPVSAISDGVVYVVIQAQESADRGNSNDCKPCNSPKKRKRNRKTEIWNKPCIVASTLS